MRHDDLVAPGGGGQTLFIPPLEEYAVLLKSNINLRSHGHEGAISSQAATARREAIEAALTYGATLGLEQSPPEPGAPLIASGHQPIFYHPGVAIKFSLLEREGDRLAATSMVVSVDSDAFTTSSINLPTERNGRLVAMEAPLFEIGPNELFESAGVEPWPQFRERLKNILPHLAADRLADPRRKLHDFLHRVESVSNPPQSVTGRMILLRRLWQAIPSTGGPLELPVSRLCQTAGFRAYASAIVKRLEEFADIYNSELAAYRKERKLRYPANPFPDLTTHRDGFVETPFWMVQGGGRIKLFARAEKGCVTLRSDSGETFGLDAIEKGVLSLRPRAITLSLYLRLFVCDLFIHGVGGAKYDLITDAIIDRFYRVAPPAYSCATLSLSAAIPCDDPADEIAAAHRRLRDMDQRPETVVPASDPVYAPLIAEKKMLVAAIQSAAPHEKKELGKKIGLLNKEFAKAVAPLRAELQQRLALLERRRKEQSVASNRTAPYFFFGSEQIDALLL